MAKEHVSLTFNTEVSINIADDETLLRMMSESGFETIFVGIETPDTEGLAECNKNKTKTAICLKTYSVFSGRGCRYKQVLSWVLIVIRHPFSSGRLTLFRKVELYRL